MHPGGRAKGSLSRGEKERDRQKERKRERNKEREWKDGAQSSASL
jgi:hypothetical protein